ncbi:T7SS effector LXG polymorphic toxin [Clostridium sp. HBUAS56017]|uniref:T7SS effector LXG polymorphic toxin n=1 Tax=Clostridium sp. HBUAS56017 TaxID=2571128 RepID=UPI001178317F|nr:T7SS effector LXG polymorphic toxin [Clostridium sp. HBUAS56017]
MARLVNSNVTEMLNQVNQYKKIVEDTFYEHYKNIYELTQTNNFRGDGATAYKEYLIKVTVNYINAFMNIAAEVSTTFEKMHNSYIALESSETGSIDAETLDNVKEGLNGKNEEFQSLAAEVEALNDEASNYISVESLNTSDVVETYSGLDSELCKINDELTEVDSNCLTEANNLLDRINELMYQLKAVANNYHYDNKINADKVKEISVQTWYKEEKADNLNIKLKEDPFYYSADAKYLSENQWARGIASDTYIYGGYTAFGGQYNANYNKGVGSVDASGSLFNVYENAQLTDYLKQKASLSLGSAAATGKIGFTDDYSGFQAKGSVSVVDANYSTVLGTDTFNGYVKANATALSAGGYVNDYVKSNGDFDFGIGGKATGAEASGTVGTSILTVPGNTEKNEYAGGKVKVSTSTSLLSLGVKGKIGLSASADADVSNTQVLDYKGVNVNAVHVKLGGCLGLGAEVDATIPVVTFDLPWEK